MYRMGFKMQVEEELILKGGEIFNFLIKKKKEGVEGKIY